MDINLGFNEEIGIRPTDEESLQIQNILKIPVRKLLTGVDSPLVGGNFSGNTRGSNSIDIQSKRSNNNQVAGGQDSIILGNESLASGSGSFSFGQSNSVLADNASAIGFGVQNGTTNSQEIGLWEDSLTRNSSIKIHNEGYVVFSAPKQNEKFKDAEGAIGSESSGEIFKGGLTFRVDENYNLIACYNDSGKILEVSLGLMAEVSDEDSPDEGFVFVFDHNNAQVFDHNDNAVQVPEELANN